MMIELGSFWAHYSMWFVKKFPNAECFMIEPSSKLLNVGQKNFQINGFPNGQFIKAKVANDGLRLDSFANEKKLKKISILHSDIQGWELEMLNGANGFLTQQMADYVFISTHSQKIHEEAIKKLESLSYIIEVSSDYDHQTTSYDGFILATASSADRIFKTFRHFGRNEIISGTPPQMIKYLHTFID